MDLLFTNEKAGMHASSYYNATSAEKPDFPTLDGDITCDVCVVGGGYTGLSAALHMAESGLDVVLIDAHRVGWGASGRNGGQLGSGQRVHQDDLEDMMGLDAAKKLWEVAQGSKDLVKSLVKKHEISCDLKPGIIYADHKKRYVGHTQKYVERLQKVYGYDQISFLNSQELSDAIGTDVYYGASLDWGAGHLHPLNFALGLARAARDAGVRIFEGTQATSIDYTTPAKVVTTSGTITANYVALGCNGYIGDLEKNVSKRVMPINSYIIATEPLGEERARKLIRDDVAVADSRFVVNYYRMSADHRMLFGGRESYGYNHPEDITGASRKRMLSIYPQLEDAKIDHAWGGTLGITMNRMPHLARLAPNILSASGFSGHGLGMATFCGKLMADAITGTADKFDLMASVPTQTFPGGKALRQTLLTLAMVYFSIRDRI